jgi:Fatty acid desaturase
MGDADTPLYDRIFRRLEKVRWSLADIPFDEIDTTLLQGDPLTFLRVNCLMELSSLYATRMFLRDFRDNPDFCQFMSIWYYEEMKHYLVLREYLKAYGMAPDASRYPELDTELSPSPWAPTLALHYCGELRLGMWYQRWSRETREPVLSKIYRLIGNDEFRHAACYEEFMEQAFQRDPDVLLDFMQAAKWMLVNPNRDKHPTTMKSALETDSSVVDSIEGYDVLQKHIQQTISDDDEQVVRRQVLATFSRLAGRPLEKLGDLAAYTRELEKSRRARAGEAAVPVATHA